MVDSELNAKQWIANCADLKIISNALLTVYGELSVGAEKY